MTRFLVGFVAVLVVATFGAGGWLLYDARERQDALERRIVELEDDLAKRSAEPVDSTVNSEDWDALLEWGARLEQRVADLESDDLWTRDVEDHSEEIEEIQAELDDVCQRLNRIDTYAVVPC